MSKTILSQVDGWTPLIDDLTRQYGLVTSAVFSRIWRYCNGEKGVCFASLETIAKDLGVNKATVMRKAKQLVKEGYLEDLTPKRRNVPHIYRDTGKAGIRINIETVAEGNTLNESVAQCNATVAQSKLKIELRENQAEDRMVLKSQRTRL